MCPSGESILKKTIQLAPDLYSLKQSLVVHMRQGQKSEGRDGLKSCLLIFHNFEKTLLEESVFSVHVSQVFNTFKFG